MQTIDLYVHAVGQHLPAKNREDIEKEIRSMIEDALEDQSQTEGRPADEAMLASVLSRLGSPEKMAANYRAPRYLIGPKLYPHFITTLKIVLSLVLTLGVIGLGVSLGWASRIPADFAKAFGQGAMGLLASAIQVLGIITLIFAIMEWTNPDFKITEKAWDPRDLRAEPDEDKVNLGESIAGVIFNLAALVIANGFSQWLGISMVQNGQWLHAPVLTSAFFQLLPWFSLMWALDAALNIILLARGRWQPGLRWASIGLNVFSIMICATVLLGPPIAALDPVAMSQFGWNLSADTIRRGSDGLNLAVQIAFGITLVVTTLEVLNSLYKLLLRGRLPALVH